MAKKLQLTHVGEDWWGRQVYKDANGNYYKDIHIFSTEPPKVLNASCPPDDYENGHHDIPELLGELAKYINGELAGGVTGDRKRQLLGMLADCEGWRTEVTSIEDFSL